MANQVICRYCKQKIDKNTAYSVKKGVYYCDEDCYNKATLSTKKKTCINCKSLFPETEMIKVANKWVCQKCYDDYIKKDEVQRDIFVDYIWHLYSPEYQTSTKYFIIKSQAEYYHNNAMYKFKYTGMLKAVKEYLYFENYKWQNQYGLGQVFPLAYYEAQERYKKMTKIKEHANDLVPLKNEKITVDNYVFMPLLDMNIRED